MPVTVAHGRSRDRTRVACVQPLQAQASSGAFHAASTPLTGRCCTVTLPQAGQQQYLVRGALYLLLVPCHRASDDEYPEVCKP
eukprot:6941493-Prymnesium_polylepis.2